MYLLRLGEQRGGAPEIAGGGEGSSGLNGGLALPLVAAAISVGDGLPGSSTASPARPSVSSVWRVSLPFIAASPHRFDWMNCSNAARRGSTKSLKRPRAVSANAADREHTPGRRLSSRHGVRHSASKNGP